MYINMTEAPLCYDAKQNGKALYYSNSFMLNLRWQIYHGQLQNLITMFKTEQNVYL